MSKSRTVVERLTELVIAHPWRMMIAGIVLLAALAPGGEKLVPQHNVRIWFPPGDPAIQRLDAFERRFGSESASVVVIHSPSGIFDKESAELIIELTDRMWKVAEVVRVESLSNFSWVRAEGDEIIVDPPIPDDQELTEPLLAERKKAMLEHELIPGYLISEDGKTATIFAWLQPAAIDKGEGEVVIDSNFAPHVKALNEMLKDFQNRGDHEIRVAGFPSMEVYLELGPGEEMAQLMPLILASIVILLLVFFRRPAGLLPLAIIVPSVLGMMGASGWVGLTINPLTVMGPNIMVILVISNSVHLLFPYFRAVKSGRTRKDAARIALNKTLAPSFFACITTGLGFLSLQAMTIPPLQELGLMVAMGTVLVWIYITALLGPLLVVLPIKRGKAVEGEEIDEDNLEDPTERSKRLTAWLDRRKGALLAGWAVLIGVSVVLAITRGQVDFTPNNFFDPRTDVRKGMDALKKGFGTTETIEVILDSGEEEGIKDPAFLKKVEALGQWIDGHDKVIRVMSLVDILKQTNRALYSGEADKYQLAETRRAVAEQYLLYTMNLPLGKNLNDQVTIRNDALRMTVLSKFDNSPDVIEMNKKIRAKAKELGLDAEVTGRLVLSYELNPRIVESVTYSIIAATVMIALVLLIIFRSFKLGLLSLMLNVIPLVIGAGIVFFLADQSYNMGTIPAFAIALGVAVDDTVHFLTGFQRLRKKGYSTREAITRLWTVIVPAMAITTLILTVCFGLFMLITFPILRMLGGLTAFILVAAFFADAVLLPTLLLLLKRDDKKGGDANSAPKATATEK